ncbi:hypothetical protein [uncultured Kordia sp.]|uniref:hypothetical protein n=1 Tax=uncultured Kordia sp. TaxID=507699 RepID=UPI002628A20E|nr:hypothetical protein [uncultured Kordia sp.]
MKYEQTKWILIILVAFILLSFIKPNFLIPKMSMIIKTEQQKDGAKKYQKDYQSYNYYIETIGTVSIDKVMLSNGKLTAIYSYKQAGEIRNVISELKVSTDNIYKGTCTTTVNGRELFSVTTWLTFNEDGSAIGHWNWSGNPTKNDPIVKISKS